MNYPNVEKAIQYARDIKSGKIPACKWVKLACKTHLAELKLSKNKNFPFYFDDNAAERVCKFIQLMPHTKGKWARTGEKITLEPWQCFFICCIFGWKRCDNDLRRYRRALLLVPRKNGKSALAAAIGLYMLAADNEHGAEIYSGATTEKQAKEVFTPAKIMAQKNQDFKDFFGVQVFASNISILENGSKFEPLIGNPGDGASPSCAITDEYHEHSDDRLLDTMETGMGAREQPLSLIITTAGDNLAGPCFQLQKDCEKILEGSLEDSTTFALIYTVDDGDDWADPSILEKANPNFGVSVDSDFLLSRLNDAKNNARKQSTYQTKHLNVWVGARNAFFNVEKWRNCGSDGLKIEDFAGQKCIIGLDLASKVDIASLVVLFPLGHDEYACFARHYLPESAVENGANEHYQGWMRDGWLTITDGEIIDFNQIKCDIIELSSAYQVHEVAYDPHQATMLVTELMNEGVPVVEMRPTVLNFSEPMKHLDALIRSGQIQHNNDPVLTWMISNVVAKEDAKDNVYPRKERGENKIDGVVSLIMALGRSMVDEGPDLNAAISGIISVNL